jgi:hypothetical protein
MDNMAVADRVAVEIAQWKPDAVFIDLGEGAGVIDRLRQLRLPVTEVAFGGKANNNRLYLNRRVEMYYCLKEWLEQGGAIPPNARLQADLTAPTYGINHAGLRVLEPKDAIKERIGRSPDLSDALALTFAAPVRPKIRRELANALGRNSRPYDPMTAFEQEWRSR